MRTMYQHVMCDERRKKKKNRPDDGEAMLPSHHPRTMQRAHEAQLETNFLQRQHTLIAREVTVVTSRVLVGFAASPRVGVA